MVSAWLYELGLGYAVPYTRRWLQCGSDLVHASRKEIEQEMGIRNPLHLKKLYLHMQLRTNEPISIYSTLPLLRVPYPEDFSIPTWLDDLGLSSYTAAFDAAAIDLLVLNHLTVDDLADLKITSELHFLSLRRGLQMLRRMNYDLSQIRRGPGSMDEISWSAVAQQDRLEKFSQKPDNNGDEPNGDGSQDVNSATCATVEPTGDASPARLISSASPLADSHNSVIRQKQFPMHVCYWSQYRVMAWLHQIELPEYAPELCGSGVHGALMILEDRFTADLLANILHIPSGKTLVRRHLTNKFAELVGAYMWERKQEVNETADIAPLTTHSKNKLGRKRGLFSTHRKRKSGVLEEEFVCPMDIDSQHAELFAEDDSTAEPTALTPTESTSIQSKTTLRETDL